MIKPIATISPFARARIRTALESPVLRNLAAVAGSSAAGQAITFAFSPMITRIYSPEAFGAQGVFLAVLSVLWPLAGMRYPMAIVVAHDEGEVRALVRLSLCIAGLVAAANILFLLSFRQQTPALFGFDKLGLLIYFLPLALFLVAMQDIMDYTAMRYAAFRTAGVVAIVQAFLINLARVLGGVVLPDATTLICVTSLSFGAQALMMRIGIRKRGVPLHDGDRAGTIGGVFREYREFPVYRMPADLVNAIAQSAPVFMLTLLFSPAAAGFYALARSVVNLPMNVIGIASGNVLYSRMAEMDRDHQPLFPFVLRTTILHLLIPGGAMAVAALVFPPLFAFVFGATWRVSGDYAQWMVLWVICMLGNIPSVRVLPVIGQQRLHLIFNILLMLGGVGGMIAGYFLHPTPLWSIAGYSLATSALYVVQIVFYMRRVSQYDAMTTLDA